MNNTIIKAPCVQMSKLKTLFIEMTAQNCNLRCKDCYINFSDKKIKDFIPVEKIKNSLSDINTSELEYICLTGAEPTLHPDFNQILRLCLKHSSVMIYTNAQNINDKKARFLKKVEEENNSGHEIIFMISIDHYIENENDKYRGRGSYRKSVHAIQSLNKYDFNPILCIINRNDENENELKAKFKELCNSLNFETTDLNFNIIPLLKGETEDNTNFSDNNRGFNTDCATSRTLTVNGVFCCPVLAYDNRGKCGNNFSDFEKKNYLETPYCLQCMKFNRNIFTMED